MGKRREEEIFDGRMYDNSLDRLTGMPTHISKDTLDRRLTRETNVLLPPEYAYGATYHSIKGFLSRNKGRIIGWSALILLGAAGAYYLST